MSDHTAIEHTPRQPAPRLNRWARKLLAALVLTSACGLASVAFPADAAAQCAMCRTAFDSPEGRKMVRRYQAGIAFLLGVPFATFGTVAFFAVRGMKKLDAEPER